MRRPCATTRRASRRCSAVCRATVCSLMTSSAAISRVRSRPKRRRREHLELARRVRPSGAAVPVRAGGRRRARRPERPSAARRPHVRPPSSSVAASSSPQSPARETDELSRPRDLVRRLELLPDPRPRGAAAISAAPAHRPRRDAPRLARRRPLRPSIALSIAPGECLELARTRDRRPRRSPAASMISTVRRKQSQLASTDRRVSAEHALKIGCHRRVQPALREPQLRQPRLQGPSPDRLASGTPPRPPR